MWLDDPDRRASLEQEFARIHADLRQGGSTRAAQAILNLLGKRRAGSSS
jgi:uncharacterized small protein (DUF1192 family)